MKNKTLGNEIKTSARIKKKYGSNGMGGVGGALRGCKAVEKNANMYANVKQKLQPGHHHHIKVPEYDSPPHRPRQPSKKDKELT